MKSILNAANLLERNKPAGFADTRVAKLRKRIHLPAELQAETHEERHIITKNHDAPHANLGIWTDSYNHKSGWSIIWMQARTAVLQAASVEVILREHRLGKFILFRIWKSEQEQG